MSMGGDPTDMQALQHTGFMHRDQFEPIENARSQFSNPTFNGLAHMIGPMFYPGVNMQPYTGQSAGYDPYSRFRQVAPQFFPGMGRYYQ
jgi:hypothetical protein